MTTRPKVFVTRSIPQVGIDLLTQEVEVEIWPHETPPSKNQLIKHTQNAQGLLCLLSDVVDKEVMEACPKLKVIANYAVGLNNIDLDEASGRKILVGYTPDVLTEATADLALALMLNVSRLISSSQNTLQKGFWRGWGPLQFLGLDLRGKTLGVVGLGRIGECLGRTCQRAFGMEVLYSSRTPKEQAEKEWGAQRVLFEELLKRSDVVSVHTDLNHTTQGLFSKKSFALMKPGAIFINTSRGGLVSQEALLEALNSQHLFGAGLDVTDPEPLPPNHPLLHHPRVVVTPHIGSATTLAREKMAQLSAQNILSGLKGRLDHGCFVNIKK